MAGHFAVGFRTRPENGSQSLVQPGHQARTGEMEPTVRRRVIVTYRPDGELRYHGQKYEGYQR